MIVEDVAYNRDLLVQILEDTYALVTASTGIEALAQAAAAHPDLILLDLALPEVDGWEVARRLKADPVLRHVPIVAVTAFAMPEDRKSALEAGCGDYLAKPIDEDELLACVQRFLEPPES
ncbi:MAG: response regulator [Alphaproteobacteria bacterium]